jgi:dTDP-4-amino-4,6-dideoxygalactose transaminase
VFSFYANKTITTGEGGMLVTRDAALAKRAKVMRLHGMSRDAFDRFTASVPSWAYEIVAPGYKYNLTDIAAALGLQQLKRLPAFQRRREEIAAAYNAEFAGLPLIAPPLAATGDQHSWHLYVARLADDAPLTRDRFIERMFEAGIGCSVHYIPLHLHPYWRDRYGLVPAQFPHSQHAYERMFTLPLYTRMTDADVQRVCDTVRALLQWRRDAAAHCTASAPRPGLGAKAGTWGSASRSDSVGSRCWQIWPAATIHPSTRVNSREISGSPGGSSSASTEASTRSSSASHA